MRGEIIGWNAASGTGEIGGADGRRYVFSGRMSGGPARRGARVVFEPRAGEAVSVRAVVEGDRTPDGVSMVDLFVRCVTGKYAGLRGRAARREYWSFVLFSLLIQILMVAAGVAVDSAVGNLEGPRAVPYLTIAFATVPALFLFVPTFCLSVRRLHDVGLSGWFYLAIVAVSAIPPIAFVGGLATVALALWPSQEIDNRHGDAAPVY